MADMCGDNRFEIIARAKKALLEGTNIDMCPDEMAVIDNILFRCWQMGWLDRYEVAEQTEPQIDGAIDEARFKAHCMNCQRDVADIKCLDCDGDKYFIPDEPQTERSE